MPMFKLKSDCHSSDTRFHSIMSRRFLIGSSSSFAGSIKLCKKFLINLELEDLHQLRYGYQLHFTLSLLNVEQNKYYHICGELLHHLYVSIIYKIAIHGIKSKNTVLFKIHRVVYNQLLLLQVQNMY